MRETWVLSKHIWWPPGYPLYQCFALAFRAYVYIHLSGGHFPRPENLMGHCVPPDRTTPKTDNCSRCWLHMNMGTSSTHWICQSLGLLVHGKQLLSTKDPHPVHVSCHAVHLASSCLKEIVECDGFMQTIGKAWQRYLDCHQDCPRPHLYVIRPQFSIPPNGKSGIAAMSSFGREYSVLKKSS